MYNQPHVPSLTIVTDNGNRLNVYFEVMNATLPDNAPSLVYAIYKGDSENDSIFNHLSIPGEIGDNIPGLDNINQKDYLGEINLSDDSLWEYEGDKLSIVEQQQIAAHIKLNANL